MGAGAKSMHNFRRFSTTSDFNREYLRNVSSCRKSENTIINYNPFHVGPKKLCEQTTEYKWLILTNPNGRFSGDYISALRGCCILKFLQTLEIDQSNLVHTPNGTGIPPKNLWRQKNRPKFFAIFDNFRLWSRISPERINISKMGKALDISYNYRVNYMIYNPSHVRRKNLAYFGPQTKSYWL